jgi:uncharacterized protein YbjT (DUF2867 family)
MLTVARSLAKLPVAPAPAGFRVQPVEADEVAARLVELTSGEPARQVPDMGGPRVYGAANLLGGYLRATKRRRRPIVPLWLPEGRACSGTAPTWLSSRPWATGAGRSSSRRG